MADETAGDKLLRETVAALQARAVYQDTVILARETLSDMTLPPAVKQQVEKDIIGTENVPKMIPMKDGGLDRTALKESISTRAKELGRMLYESGLSLGRPVGVGEELLPQIPAAEIAAREAREQRDQAEAEAVFTDLMQNKEAAKFAARGRAA